MTTREVIHLILQDVHKGTPPAMARLRPRRIYAAAIGARAGALESYRRRFTVVSAFNYVTVPCAPTEKVNFNECGCVPVQGCTLYKVKCKIAASFGITADAITDVTHIDGKTRYSSIEWRDIAYLEAVRYAEKERYFIRNNHIYIISENEVPPTITFRLLPDDPASLSDCGCPNDKQIKCAAPLDAEFPIDANLLEDFIRRTKNILFGTNTKQDTANDYVDTTSI